MARNNDWMEDFFTETEKKPSKPFEGYFTHCVACNQILNSHYVEIGLCGDCNRVSNRCSNPVFDVEDRVYMEKYLWSNPQGSIEDSVYEHAASQLDGTGEEI